MGLIRSLPPEFGLYLQPNRNATILKYFVGTNYEIMESWSQTNSTRAKVEIILPEVKSKGIIYNLDPTECS